MPNSEVPIRLAEFDIYINTTRLESFGVAVFEAAAIGVPIVSTSVGEMPYLWKNNVDILLVPDGDSRAMANAVKRLFTEPDLAEQLSHNARCKAEKYDWSVVIPKWEQCFMECNDQFNNSDNSSKE